MHLELIDEFVHMLLGYESFIHEMRFELDYVVGAILLEQFDSLEDGFFYFVVFRHNSVHSK